MSKTFKIRTYCTATYEYIVKANTQEEAEEKFYQGQSKPCNGGMPIDIMSDEYKRAIEEALTVMRDVVEGYVGLEDVADEIEQEVKEQLLQ